MEFSSIPTGVVQPPKEEFALAYKTIFGVIIFSVLVFFARIDFLLFLLASWGIFQFGESVQGFLKTAVKNVVSGAAGADAKTRESSAAVSAAQISEAGKAASIKLNFFLARAFAISAALFFLLAVLDLTRNAFWAAIAHAGFAYWAHRKSQQPTPTVPTTPTTPASTI